MQVGQYERGSAALPFGRKRDGRRVSYDCGDKRRLIPTVVGEVKKQQRDPGKREGVGLVRAG